MLPEWVLNVAVPATGCLLAWCLGFSPIPGLLRDSKRNQLSTDPTPFPLALTNAFSWVLFSVILNDRWLCAGNSVAVMLSTYSTVTALRLCRDPVLGVRIQTLTICGMGAILLLLLLGVSTLLLDDKQSQKQIVGSTAMVICIGMFLSPCLEAGTALKSGDGSKISAPLTAASIACTMFWTLYGFAVAGEFQIWFPNLTGAILSCFVLFAKLYLRWTSPEAGVCASDVTPFEVLQGVTPAGMTLMLGTVGMTGYLTAQHDPVEACTRLQRAERGTEFVAKRIEEDCVTLQAPDGRYVRVVERAGAPLGKCESRWPGLLAITLVDNDSPTASDVWLVLDAPIEASDDTNGRHQYAAAGVSFFNTSKNVFLRLNDVDELDVSAIDHEITFGEEEGAPLMKQLPAGWHLERFSVSLVSLGQELATSEANNDHNDLAETLSFRGRKVGLEPGVPWTSNLVVEASQPKSNVATL